MKAYTINPNYIGNNIKLSECGKFIEVGEEGRGRKRVCVPLPYNAILEENRLVGIESKKVVIFLSDHSGFRGSWNADFPDAGVKVIAEGRRAQGIAGYAGGGPEYLLLVDPGVDIRITRSGRIYSSPKKLSLRVDFEGNVSVVDLEAEADTKKAEDAWDKEE